MKKILVIFIILCCNLTVYAISDSATSSVVLDTSSRRILYQKNKDEKRLIASITKIMTAVVAIENKNLDDVVTVGEEVLPMYGSNIYIEVGEKMTLRNLLYGLLLRSGNDAAVVLAKYVGGSEENFVKMMNKKAQEIGMKNTIFSNSHGLDEDTQNYSTAYDMALLSSYASTLLDYCDISSTKKWTVSTGEKTYVWYNRNKLLKSYKYATGGKTGYTPKAGRTLVTTANKNNLNLTAVTLNDGDEYYDHEKLYEYVFSLYDNILLIDKNNFSVENFNYDGNVYVKESFFYPLTKKEQKLVKVVSDIYTDGDFKDDEKIGDVIVSLNDKEIYREDIYVTTLKKSEKKENFFVRIFNFFKNLFN